MTHLIYTTHIVKLFIETLLLLFFLKYFLHIKMTNNYYQNLAEKEKDKRQKRSEKDIKILLKKLLFNT